jgi:hypothetical protein
MNIWHNSTFLLAYLDLGSGSFLIQMIIATLLGGALFFKAFWHQIMGIFRRGSRPVEPNDELD